MKTRRVLAGAVTIAALAGGTAGAIAAGTGGKAAEQAVLDDAAKRLGVTSGALRDALGAAEDAQLDAAVKAGELTQEQADELKAHRRADGSVLRLGPDGDHHRGGPGFGPGGPHGPGHGGPLDDVADALGIGEQRLFEQLRAGTSLAAIAKANGKTLADVRAAVKASVTERLDDAVADGDLTKAQRDEMLEHLDEHLAHLGERRPGFDRDHRGRP
jgi:hypothetical protein